MCVYALQKLSWESMKFFKMCGVLAYTPYDIKEVLNQYHVHFVIYWIILKIIINYH